MSKAIKRIFLSMRVGDEQKTASFEIPADICVVPGINFLFTRANHEPLRVPISQVDINPIDQSVFARVSPEYKNKMDLLEHESLEFF
jgi:hypothetical protein